MANRLQILLVEDNPDDVFLLGEAFKKAKVDSRLHAVPDGIEALAYLNGDGSYRERNTYPFPDMMLLDLNMPKMNGFEVLSRVRKNDQYGHMIVHVLTTSCRQEDVCRAYKMHANSYVVKPPRIDEMVRLADVLHKWHGFVSLPNSKNQCAKG